MLIQVTDSCGLQHLFSTRFKLLCNLQFSITQLYSHVSLADDSPFHVQSCVQSNEIELIFYFNCLIDSVNGINIITFITLIKLLLLDIVDQSPLFQTYGQWVCIVFLRQCLPYIVFLYLQCEAAGCQGELNLTDKIIKSSLI